ncbi:MAG TPA: hypothetical protein VJS92_01575, partial [Candidatus Polarisedimenticolaceae bacterium]|nr:hypothetical protein [Candidatus Polarisedimenticolaceae bacterium]
MHAGAVLSRKLGWGAATFALAALACGPRMPEASAEAVALHVFELARLTDPPPSEIDRCFG